MILNLHTTRGFILVVFFNGVLFVAKVAIIHTFRHTKSGDHLKQDLAKSGYSNQM
jgi:hypothetical protein